MVKDSITRGYIVGFTDLGNTDEFSTEMLAWRLGHVGFDLFMQCKLFAFPVMVACLILMSLPPLRPR